MVIQHDKTDILIIGAGASGTVGGIISGVMPGGLSFGGAALPSVIGGVIIKKLSKKQLFGIFLFALLFTVLRI